MFLVDHPRPTTRQVSGGDRHLKFHEHRDNLQQHPPVRLRQHHAQDVGHTAIVDRLLHHAHLVVTEGTQTVFAGH
jgi:hypothetical protein